MSIVLPNATELRKVSEQAKENIIKAWLEDVKEKVIDDAKYGLSVSVIDIPHNEKYQNEVRNLFEPLGYAVKFMKGNNYSDSIQIMW